MRLCGKTWIVPPPVDPDQFRLVYGANEQTHLNGEQLHIRQVDLDVARDHETFVENTVEDVNQTMAAGWCY
jgi:hypothetical protein